MSRTWCWEWWMLGERFQGLNESTFEDTGDEKEAIDADDSVR
jgi:hypothetical protein